MSVTEPRERLAELTDCEFDGVSLTLLALAAAAIGYEVGSVAAGAEFDPLWLVPVLGMTVVLLAQRTPQD